jgi:hypothetical protein
MISNTSRPADPAPRKLSRGIALLAAALLSASVLVVPRRAHAGAWAQENNGLYAKLSLAWSTANAQFKENGETFQLVSEDVTGDFTTTGALLYAEYGLLPRVTIYTNTLFQRMVLDSEIQRASVTGFGDLWMGTRVQFLDKPLVLSASAAGKFPTGYTPDPGLMIPVLGNGVHEVEGRLLVGKSFWPVRLYASGEIGYRHRGSRQAAGGGTVDFADEIPYFVEIGYSIPVGAKALDSILVRGVLNGLQGLGDPENLDAFSLTPLTQSFLKVGPSIILTTFGSVQINVDYAYTLLGVNMVRSHDVLVGVAIDTTL